MSTDPGRLQRIEFEVGGSDLERLVVVCDDLAFLQQLPRDELPSHGEVRATAGVLRRLLLDGGGELFKVWRLIDKGRTTPLTVSAADLGAFLNQWPDEWIRHAWAGGAKFPHAHHTGFALYHVPKAVHEPFGSPEAFIAAQGMPAKPAPGRFSLGQWLDTPGAAIQTDSGLYVIKRKSIVNYVANRKGGVHFDPSRDLSVSGVKQRRRNAEYHLLDHGLLRVGHLSGPEFEVLSIAQVIADAEWCAELIRIGQEIAPTEFGGDPAELKFWTGAREADGTG